MATIIELGDARRSIDTGHDDRTLTWMIGSMLVALAVVLGVPVIGMAVAGLFCIGMLLARLERRSLGPVEFVAVVAVHVAAVVLLAF